ncbi:Pkinase-domain-containing protein [Obba rivulosa]|uniref:Pkinase-domain-containing protein n=1 Tax=Obba rivulosa TaxID=1052685 RepID=A0A8E2AMX3_9APHY|nr:Pkinase-domain-containing protein [Obba rivulosa]
MEYPAADAMLTDTPGPSTQQEETQATQSTQDASQGSQPNPAIDAHLWGYLIPCNPAVPRIDFIKHKPTYTIGRNQEHSDCRLMGMKISNTHCRIFWDGKEDRTAAITVYDMSSNGTFINGMKVGKGRHALLHDGNEIAFGTVAPQTQNGGAEDYRYVFRHVAAGEPATGLHAEYQIDRELGKGSFATVMRAMHRPTGQWYALKVIQRSRLRSGDSQSFSREISILERLQHPNICQFKEAIMEEHTINLVLEYVKGGDLLDFILNEHGLSEPLAQHLTYQICDALSYIHDQGIAHRDLKPENILLTDENPPQVKVADFGLAKAVDSLTMLRTMCGTPCYLAPEVVLQTQNEGYDHVVDSWSVGVIVFSMLTESSPFTDEDQNLQVKARILSRTVEWGLLRERGVSRAAEHFVRRLLDYEPRSRMTLKAARDHPWLQMQRQQAQQAGTYRARTASPEPQSANPVPVDASMRSVIPDDASMQHDEPDEVPMDAEPTSQDSAPSQKPGPSQDAPSQESTPRIIPGAFPSSQADGINRAGSRLQRRAEVTAASQEMGHDPLDTAADDSAGDTSTDGPPSSSPQHKAPRKRKASLDFEASLTPMAEEEVEEDEQEESDDPPVANGRRKGKASAATPATPRRGRGARARPPASARTRAARGASAVNCAMEAASSEPRPRRSGRLSATPQKAPRRV